jgi:hypothetical protein
MLATNVFRLGDVADFEIKMLKITILPTFGKPKKTNPACKEFFDRLVAKGKNKKLAIIAVCNKLLKQVFGVVKSGKMFDRDYCVKQC